MTATLANAHAEGLIREIEAYPGYLTRRKATPCAAPARPGTKTGGGPRMLAVKIAAEEWRLGQLIAQ